MTSPIKRLGVSKSRCREFVLYNIEVPGDYNIVMSLPVGVRSKPHNIILSIKSQCFIFYKYVLLCFCYILFYIIDDYFHEKLFIYLLLKFPERFSFRNKT